MFLKVGKKYLLTIKEQLIAPSGVKYNAIFGTVKRSILDKDMQVFIGNCQIPIEHILYAISTDEVWTVGQEVDIYQADNK